MAMNAKTSIAQSFLVAFLLVAVYTMVVLPAIPLLHAPLLAGAILLLFPLSMLLLWLSTRFSPKAAPVFAVLGALAALALVATLVYVVIPRQGTIPLGVATVEAFASLPLRLLFGACYVAAITIVLLVRLWYTGENRK